MISRNVRKQATRDAIAQNERGRGLPVAGAGMRLSSLRTVEQSVPGVHRLPVAYMDEYPIQNADGSFNDIPGWSDPAPPQGDD